MTESLFEHGRGCTHGDCNSSALRGLRGAKIAKELGIPFLQQLMHHTPHLQAGESVEEDGTRMVQLVPDEDAIAQRGGGGRGGGAGRGGGGEGSGGGDD